MTFGSDMPHKEKASSMQTALDGIRDLIMEGEIRPGELLAENELAQYFNMSRTPVREAIRQLQAEGLLESKKGLGTYVKPLSLRELKNLYEVEEMLEAGACRLAVPYVTKEEMSMLREELNSCLERAGELSPKEILAAEDLFYTLMLEKSGNPYLKSLTEKFRFHKRQCAAAECCKNMQAEERIREQLELADALYGRDLARLKELLSASLQREYEQSRREVLQWIEK